MIRRPAVLFAAFFLFSASAPSVFSQDGFSGNRVTPKRPAPVSPADVKKQVTDLYERGNRLLDAHRYAEAERSFLDALKITPDLAALHHGLGLVYMQTQDYELAVLHLQEALRLEPDRAKTLYVLSKAYAAVGDDAKAKEGYLRVIQLDPMMEVAHQDLAGIFYRAKKWDEALASLERAKAVNPRSPHTLTLMGVTGIHAGRQDVALDAVTELRHNGNQDEARRLEYLIYSAGQEAVSAAAAKKK